MFELQIVCRDITWISLLSHTESIKQLQFTYLILNCIFYSYFRVYDNIWTGLNNGIERDALPPPKGEGPWRNTEGLSGAHLVWGVYVARKDVCAAAMLGLVYSLFHARECCNRMPLKVSWYQSHLCLLVRCVSVKFSFLFLGSKITEICLWKETKQEDADLLFCGVHSLVQQPCLFFSFSLTIFFCFHEIWLIFIVLL